MASITVGEILRFAVRMEKNGEKFYRDFAGISPSAKVTNLFLRLASEEAAHKKIFEGLVEKADSYGDSGGYPSEYLEYFYNYIDNKDFFKEGVETSLPKSLDTQSALDFALKMELDSVVFYREMKTFVPVEDNKTIEAIIDEEWRHFSQISELKKNPD